MLSDLSLPSGDILTKNILFNNGLLRFTNNDEKLTSFINKRKASADLENFIPNKFIKLNKEENIKNSELKSSNNNSKLINQMKLLQSILDSGNNDNQNISSILNDAVTKIELLIRESNLLQSRSIYLHKEVVRLNSTIATICYSKKGHSTNLELKNSTVNNKENRESNLKLNSSMFKKISKLPSNSYFQLSCQTAFRR